MSQYTKAHPEYAPTGDTFMHWEPGYAQYLEMCRLNFAGGYKIHVSADPSQAAQVAATALPLLRQMSVYHKVVTSRPAYDRLNRGAQRGKFMTIYSGPLMDTFLRVTTRLDNVLAAKRFTPGPTPYARLGGHQKEEQATGQSGLLFYIVTTDFKS